MMADMEQELNHSKERAETLEREVIGLDYRILVFTLRQQMECKFRLLKLQVISLRVKSESRSVGVQVDELVINIDKQHQLMHLPSLHFYLFSYQPKDVTPDHQNNSQTPAVKIERIEGTSVSSRNMFTNTTNKGRPKGISRSPSTIVSTAHIFDVLTAICNKNEVAVKTEKLQKISVRVRTFNFYLVQRSVFHLISILDRYFFINSEKQCVYESRKGMCL